jgi:hypothetical protein
VIWLSTLSDLARECFHAELSEDIVQIVKILSGAVCFVFAALSLIMVVLMALAWAAQYSVSAAKLPPSVSIMIGPWTLSGWQIYAVISLFVMLVLAFITCGVYLFRSCKTAG